MSLEELKEYMTLKDCAELKNFILQNPDLPLLIFVGEEACYTPYDFPYVSCSSASPRIDELTLYKEEEWVDKEAFREKIENDLCDIPEYNSLTDEEFYKKVDEIVDSTPFTKAIVIYLG